MAEIDSQLPSNDHVHVSETRLSVRYTVSLSEFIDSSSKGYFELLHLLYEARPSDIVVLVLGNFGGAIEQGLKICNALQNCSAYTKVVVDAPCYSMGAIIALCGDELQLLPGTFLMFHNYSTEQSGKAGELTLSADAHNKLYNRLLHCFCAPFLTSKEIRNIIQDKDVYIYDDDKDLPKRVKQHFKGKA